MDPPKLLNGKKIPLLDFGALGRSKVALKPGRSLMDWIRLTNTSQDLSSTGGKPMVVTMEELQKHNTIDDAWICLSGDVYNISPYLEYHPGGEEELMRGAGRDATDLFNQIHRWVNAESMLKKCYIGPMKASMWLRSPPSSLKKEEKKDELDSANSSTVESTDSGLKVGWKQTKEYLQVMINNLQEAVKNHHIIVDLTENKLSITLNFEKCVYKCNIKLGGSVVDDYTIDINEGSECGVQITLPKVLKELWPDLESPSSMPNLLVPTDRIDQTYRPCTLVNKVSVNYNTVLLSFQLPPGSTMHVPIGHHVHIKATIDDSELVRSYTPVVPSLSILSADPSIADGHNVHLMVKIYPDGLLTPTLNNCEIGQSVSISGYIGTFSLESINACSMLIMLAAGTGITPMIKIIHFLSQSKDEKKMFLTFFNKTQEDILWKDELEILSKTDERFSVCHVLSEPSEHWQGETGTVSRQLLEQILPACTVGTKMFCVCGSPLFTESVLRYLEELDYSSENIHAFTG